MVSKIDYDISDSNLVISVRENNDDAKDYLYEKYSPLIHKEINRFKKRASVFEVDFADLSQEAMLAFSHAINNYKDDEEVKFITFATLCIRRRLSNFIAKYTTNKNKMMTSSIALDAVMDDEKTSFIDQLQSVEFDDPLYKMINNETLKEIKRTIEEDLSENEKIALGYDLDGKSAEEIALLMNMNIKQIYNLIHRARTKIKL